MVAVPAVVDQSPGMAAVMEKVIAEGDLSKLTPEQRVFYYQRTCESLGLNPLTNPFQYIVLNDKLTLYATRGATDQLRTINNISVEVTSRETIESVYVVTARATTPDGRTDEATGAVSIVKEDGTWESNNNGKRFFKPNGKLLPLRPDDYANACMKAETKAKRRVTLSICGLGWIDESELETVRGAQRMNVDFASGEIQGPSAQQPALPAFNDTGEILDEDTIRAAVDPGQSYEAMREQFFRMIQLAKHRGDAYAFALLIKHSPNDEAAQYIVGVTKAINVSSPEIDAAFADRVNRPVVPVEHVESVSVEQELAGMPAPIPADRFTT